MFVLCANDVVKVRPADDGRSGGGDGGGRGGRHRSRLRLGFGTVYPRVLRRNSGDGILGDGGQREVPALGRPDADEDPPGGDEPFRAVNVDGVSKPV